MEQRNTAQTEIFGSFFLDQSEFALPVHRTQEVVNLPERLTQLPLAPPHLLGVFNLRGAIIPVIDLKALLQLNSGEEAPAHRKIAIIEYGGLRIGLLLDRTGEIFRYPVEQESKLDYDADRSPGAVVSGVIKLEEGQRLIQILDVQALMDLEGIPRCDDATDAGGESRILAKKRSTRRQAIAFVVGETACAFGIDAIHEIIRVPEIKKSAFASEYCPGMIELRGETVSVIDFARLLGRVPASSAVGSEERRIVILKQGTERIGLLVESVSSILTYTAEDLLSLPVLNPSHASVFAGCISLAGTGDFILLHPEAILRHPEIMSIVQAHQKMYRDASANATLQMQKKGQRRTYITFKVSALYALGMNEIKEIIGLPTELLRPPGLPDFVHGLLNLRGRMITLLDARTLYRIHPRNEGEPAQVLIFEHQGGDYGLIVDSIESIISFAEEEQLKLPDMLYRGRESGGIAEDVKFAVEVELNQEKTTLFILNLEPLTKRMALGA